MILPSRREPFGRIVIEALSSGLFVITQNSVGASKDIDENYLSATFSENGFSELNILIKDVVSRIEQIRSSREKRIDWVTKNWTHDVSAEGLLKMIQMENKTNSLALNFISINSKSYPIDSDGGTCFTTYEIANAARFHGFNSIIVIPFFFK